MCGGVLLNTPIHAFNEKKKNYKCGRFESLGIKAQLCNYTVASTYKSQKVRESEHLRSANTNAIPLVLHTAVVLPTYSRIGDRSPVCTFLQGVVFQLTLRILAFAFLRFSVSPAVALLKLLQSQCWL